MSVGIGGCSQIGVPKRARHDGELLAVLDHQSREAMPQVMESLPRETRSRKRVLQALRDVSTVQGPPTLRGDRVTLDALRRSDADDMVLADDDEAREAFGYETPLTKDKAVTLVNQAALGWQAGSVMWFAIRPRDSRSYAGRLSLRDDKSGQGSVIQIMVAPAYRKQGLGSEAVELARTYTYKTLFRRYLLAIIRRGNRASIRLAESRGFARLDDPSVDEPDLVVYVHHRDPGSASEYRLIRGE